MRQLSGIVPTSRWKRRLMMERRLYLSPGDPPGWRVLLLLAVLSCCMGEGLVAAEPRELAVEVGSVQRTAEVYPPSGPPPPSGYPVVLVFHGHGGNASRQARRLGVHERWPEAIVVYPQGLPGIPGRTDPRGVRTGWQMFPGQAEDRDIVFVDRLLEELPAQYPIDAKRIYAAGHSNGGRFAAVLWVTRPARFAAFASACGQGGWLIRDAEPKPVMMIMGERDRIVPIRGQLFSAELAREALKSDAAGAQRDGLLTREKGIDGSELVTYIHPGGHEWPREVTPLVVDFFRRHTLRPEG